MKKNLMPLRSPSVLSRLAGALLCGLMLTPLAVQAQKVSAELSQDVTAVGQPVQLNVSIVGGRGAKVPNQVSIPGLEVRFVGRSEQVNVVNFQVTSTSIYSYLIVPMQTGEFTIPSMSVNINGRSYNTAPLTLRVGGNSGGVPVMPAIPVHPSQQGQPPGGMPSYVPPAGRQYPTADQAPAEPADPAFGELIIPKKTAYVGEVIPAELRFYFSASYPARIADRPTFSGDGFTVLNFSQPAQREQEVNGHIYNVIIFQTAITPVKSGSLEVSPANIEAQVTMPGQGGGANQDDFFGNFFGQGFGMESRQITVSTKPQQLEVKPLPKEGRPDDFSGAIGQFTLQASANPKKAEAGEPITLNAVISGRGNFEAIGAPTLMDAENWKSYPPSEKFTSSPNDPIGFNGQKSFSYTIVARTDATLTPSPEFSFFDPAVEKYVTLKANPVAVVARGSAGASAPATTAVAAASAKPSVAPVTPAATPPPTGTELLATNFDPASFEPFVASKGFLIASGATAVIWLAFILFSAGRALTHSEAARRSARRREARHLLQKTDDLSVTPEQFYQGAEEFIRARLAPDGSVHDTRELLTRSDLPVDVKHEVSTILDRADEGRYSTGSVAHLGADERQTIIKQLKAFDEKLGA